MSGRLIKRASALILAFGFFAGCSVESLSSSAVTTSSSSSGNGLEFKDPDEVAAKFNATDADAVIYYEDVDLNDVIVKELGNHFGDAKLLRKFLEDATQNYIKAVADNKDVDRYKANLEALQAEFDKSAAYELGLKNLLMISNEGVAKNEKSEDLKESTDEAACPYHLKSFHSSDAFNVFEPETQDTDVEEEKAAPSMEDAAADSTIDSKREQELVEGVSEPEYEGGYVSFKKYIYYSHKLIGEGNLIKDSEGNPVAAGDGNLLTSAGELTVNKDDYVTLTFTSADNKTYQGKFKLEDDNILNYLRYKYHRDDLTKKAYENIYNFLDADAKNSKGKKLEDDAKKSSAYLPPPEYVGTFGSVMDSNSVLKFFTTNLFSPFSNDDFKSSKLGNAELNTLKSAAKQEVTKEDMGYCHNLMCTTHLTSYHIITNSLISYVGKSAFDNWRETNKSISENINIVKFRKDFKIDEETFKTLTLNPDLSMAPYNVEMVYADDKTGGEYFRFGKAL